MAEQEKYPEFTEEELEEQTAEALPEREQMSLITPITPIGGGIGLPVEPPQGEGT